MNPILIPLMFFSKMKPSNLTFMILSMSILTNIYFNTQSSNKWFPLILTLMFSGGIMILFSFFTSILPNTKNPKMKPTTFFIILLILILTSNKKTNIQINNSMTQLAYNKESMSLLMITCILMMLTLNLKPQTIKTFSPLKSSS